MSTVAETQDARLSRERILAIVCAFAALAVPFAAIGISFVVLSFTASDVSKQEVQEINKRLGRIESVLKIEADGIQAETLPTP